ncbi:MAG: helix-turn-helix transcriptional regulator [Clostridia bacterium]|nr:helix-turn-helix transcriptional regulator [Clostridia bacterium]
MYRRIKDLREDRDWTQQKVADMLHICRSTYSAYENGANAFPIEILISLSKIYKTSIDYLLDQTDNPVPYERKH